MKIAVIGNPGSGKSTLASQLHKILNIPLFHLDQYFWQPGWQRPDRDAFIKIHHQLCDANEWIIEGMAARCFDYRAQQAVRAPRRGFLRQREANSSGSFENPVDQALAVCAQMIDLRLEMIFQWPITHKAGGCSVIAKFFDAHCQGNHRKENLGHSERNLQNFY